MNSFPYSIGNADNFSIHFALDADPGGEWMFGRICYWICNEQIGDYALGTSLRDVLLQMTHIIADSGKRRSDTFYTLSKEDAFARLKDTLYGNRRTGFEEIAIEETWARFNITIPVDVFDNWKVFQFDAATSTRVIWKHEGDANAPCREVSLPLGVTDAVFLELHSVLGRIHDELSGSSAR